MHLEAGRYWGIFLLLLLLYFPASYGQEEQLSGTALLDALISEKKIDEAQSTLHQQIDAFRSAGQLDSLYRFPEYIGKITQAKQGNEAAHREAKSFIDALRQETSNARTWYKSYLSFNKLLVFLGDDENSVEAAKKALEYAETLQDVTPEELGKIHYTIGGDYYALYNLSEALHYFKASAKAYEKSQSIGKEVLADSYNGIAVSMWTLNKLDSAQIYFNKAIEATHQSDLTAYDRSYYITAFQFNLALVVDAQGRLGEAITIKKELIQTLDDIIKGSQDDFLVKKAKRLRASAVSNLAAFYHDTGYLTKAYEMMKFAYEKKKEVYESTSPRLATALGQIATSEIGLQEFDQSIETVDLALGNLREASSRYPSVEADLLFAKAKALAGKKDMENAKNMYEQSEALFNEAYPKELSREYLLMLNNYALFLAENKEHELAISMANKSYQSVLKSNGADTFPLLKELSILAEVYYKSGQYEQAYEWAQKGNQSLNERLQKASSKLDSIQVEYNRPSITWLEVQSSYKMSPANDVTFLRKQIAKLDQAVSYLERRKTTAFSVDDIQKLLSEYKRVNTLSKQLHYDAFRLTGDATYLAKTIALHESGIYNRIRTKFNIRNNIGFGTVPAGVLEREKNLKNAISTTINTEGNQDIESFLGANEKWEQFLDTLQQVHPKYYQLRYATIEQPLGNVKRTLPNTTTVVRYFFIDTQLYVFLLNEQLQEIIPLDYEPINELMTQLGEDQSNFETTAARLAQLYNVLWKPFEDKINTSKIVIIPDGPLFNISFETLTPSPISSFQELSTNSLLARYVISYNYSLFLLEPKANTFHYDENFVAFAPEFNDKMKEAYQLSITDSIELDKTYISLLPQPFSAELVQKTGKMLNGLSFINDRSTKQVFKKNAKEHKIIHIGTHAESNNLTPEFSRLIFAKDVGNEDASEDNSLFTYEIYDYNLSSNLTILTACETGKPAYQPGEGMISLAHAFNYAGSQSMLTSLWRIDEKSSTEIMAIFYENLSKGLDKDEALQQAKLSYLNSAEGRTIAPQYWAGLVLIGDTQPLDLNASNYTVLWLIGIGLIIILLFLLYKRSQTSQRLNHFVLLILLFPPCCSVS